MEIKLKRLLHKELGTIFRLVLQLVDQPFGIYDTEGQLLFGEDCKSESPHPIELEGEIVAQLHGQNHAELIAKLVIESLEQVVEKKRLANEVLDKYREINLLYAIAERLTDCRELYEVAKLALEEAERLISATSSTLFLLDSGTKTLVPVNFDGVSSDVDQSQLDRSQSIPIGEGIEGYVAQTSKAELINDRSTDLRHRTNSTLKNVGRSVLCAPMKTRERTIGVIAIYHAEPARYKASDLKLLTVIALQSTPAIESALFYQKQLEEARLREESLQAQLTALRVNIDQAKRQQEFEAITETDFFKELEKKRQKFPKTSS